MTMTESEICVSYRQAKNKNEQVKILADLNLCKPEDITELLARNGYITGTPQVKKQEEKKMPSKRENSAVILERYIGLADIGFTVAEAAEALGIARGSVYKYAKNHGIRFADMPAEKKKAAPAVAATKAAKSSKEDLKQLKNSTKPKKKQAVKEAGTIPENEDKPAELLDTIEALQFLLWEAAPKLVKGGKVVGCVANENHAALTIEKGKQLYQLSLEVLCDGK